MRKLKLPNWKLLLLFPEHRVLSVLIIGAAAVAGTALAITNEPDTKPNLVMSQLNALQARITGLQELVTKPIPEINLSGITQQVQQLSKQIVEVHTQNSAHFDQSLSKTETALVMRLESIQQLIRRLDAHKSPVKFLNPKDLPFKVISLDSIQHIPVASIAYDFKTIPLEKDDSLAGWKVIHIDYGKQQLEFENSKKERVVLSHEQIG